MTPKKILIITRNLPPVIGGMERLNWHMADELSKSAEVRLIGPREAESVKPDNVDFTSASLKPLWRFLLGSSWKSIKQALHWKPDIVIAGSGLTAPIALFAARLCGASSVAYLHGLDINVNHRGYRTFWLPMIRRMDNIIANSRPTAELAKQAGIKSALISIVHPGTKLPEIQKPQEEISRILSEKNIKNKKILLSVGRLTTRKGLLEFVKLALPIITSKEPETILLIVGDTPKSALHAEFQTRESIQSAADAAGVGKHLKFLGVVEQDFLATLYQAAHVHVFPIRNIPGDPEGFGMVAIEAASYGLPTAAFSTGGVVDAISEGQSGMLVAEGDYPALANAVVMLLNSKKDYESLCIKFSHRFSWKSFGEKLLRSLTSDQKNIEATEKSLSHD